MSILVSYINKIYKQWVIYLGFIPALYDLLNAYLGYKFKFPNLVLIGFPIIIFLYATYKTYKNEYLKRIDLEKKLEGPTNYQITATLYPVDFSASFPISSLGTMHTDIKHIANSMILYNTEMVYCYE